MYEPLSKVDYSRVTIYEKSSDFSLWIRRDKKFPRFVTDGSGGSILEAGPVYTWPDGGNGLNREEIHDIHG